MMHQTKWRADLGLMKILCATDGSEASERAVDFAIHMVRSLDLPLTFISVFAQGPTALAEGEAWGPQLLDMPRIPDEGSIFSYAAVQARENILSRVRCVGIYGGDIAGTIAEYADFNGYEMIVVGSRGQSVLKDILVGSVVTSLMQQAKCPVTVVS